MVDAALDAGINHFDTAESYGNGQSEEFLGTALGARRGEAVITTKFGACGFARGHGAGERGERPTVRSSSLARLGTDYVDLYLLHVPDPDDAHRRDARRARQADRRGQGARDRLLELLRRAARRGGRRSRARTGCARS